MSVRIFLSDLLAMDELPKLNKKSVLVRDILVIYAIVYLQKLGFTPTKNLESKSDSHRRKVTACQIVFEELVARGLEFADSASTIEKIWSRRRVRFKKIELDEFLP